MEDHRSMVEYGEQQRELLDILGRSGTAGGGAAAEQKFQRQPDAAASLALLMRELQLLLPPDGQQYNELVHAVGEAMARCDDGAGGVVEQVCHESHKVLAVVKSIVGASAVDEALVNLNARAQQQRQDLMH
jgi:hypothetical protein